MKIFIVCETPLSERNAQTTQIIEMATNLKRMGHKVILFAPNIGKYYKDIDLKIVYIWTLNIFALRSIVYQVFLFFYMIRYYFKFKPNAIYCRLAQMSISPVVLSITFKIPYIVHLADDIVKNMEVHNRKELCIGFYKKIEKLNCKYAHKITTIRPEIRNILQKRCIIPSNTIFVIPNGVNVDLFYPEDKEKIRKKLNLINDGYYIGFQGGLDPWQGIEYLIQAAPFILEKHPNTHFLIVGDGKMKEKLIELAEKTGVCDKFIFTGSVLYEDVPRYINACDVCVVYKKPLKSGYSPLKLYEYMACGKPVVASRVEGFEILEQTNAGIVVPSENPQKLAEAIIKLLQDKELREQMGKNGRKYVVENSSWANVAKKVEKVCEEAIAEKQKQIL